MTTKRAIALKPFAFSADGTNTRQVQKDEVLEMPENIFEGLKARGEVGDAPEGKKGEITEPVRPAEPNWDGLGDKELVAIIRTNTGEEVIAGAMSHAVLLAKAQWAWRQGKRETKEPGAQPAGAVAGADGRRTGELAESASGNPLKGPHPEQRAFAGPNTPDRAPLGQAASSARRESDAGKAARDTKPKGKGHR